MKHSHHNPDSLHKLLAERRRVLDISLEEISQKTAIPTKHLQRIERGEWERLPSSVYTKGFLRKYARLVGYNPDEVVRSYKVLHESSEQSASTQSNKKDKSFIQRLALSPKIARITGVLLVVVFIMGYAAYQLRTVVAHPDITLTEPAQQEVVVSSDTITFKGKTQAGTEVFLNQQPVSVGVDGAFQEEVELLPGINSFTISAVSRFNKETRIERQVIYTP